MFWREGMAKSSLSSIKPILFVIGILTTILSLTMVIPATIDWYYHNEDSKAFLTSFLITCFTGVTLTLTNHTRSAHINLKHTFILITLSWMVLCAFSALPLMFADLQLSYTDAVFEMMSGLTGTGATVIAGLDGTPPGILMWRSIVQWLGGIGVVVMALAVFPMLKIGGMQLFRSESYDKSDKVLPRATQVAGAVTGVYLLLTVTCMICYWIAGMSGFDAIAHAMTTLATGGFSTHDASIGYFDSPLIETVCTLFMILGSLPFVLYVQMLRGKDVLPWKDEQVQWFLMIISFSVMVTMMWLVVVENMGLAQALRYSSFTIVSVVSTTGFSSIDYTIWGNFIVAFVFMLLVVGGCSGSTSGGIKVFRYKILYHTANMQIARLLRPNAVMTAQFNGKPISDEVKASVMGFFILFAFTFLVMSVLLSLTGLDYMTSMSGAATVMSNVGLGVGDIIGPGGNFASLPDTSKWILTAGMLLGRLELFTVLVMFSPHFWKS
jgi:trk system potassium uptake protein TrkH